MRKYGKFILILLIIIFSITSVMIFAGAFILYRYSQSHVEDDILELVSANGQTEFYRYDFLNREARVGEPILIEDAVLNYETKYVHVSYNEIPKHLVNAFVAIEDKRFWDHNGIDYLRSSKATLNYIFKGQKSFGGSTITQQLVKNLTGNDQYLIERKLSEAFSALNLEREYDKSEIIEMYLNIINLSNGCRGVGAAARYYFSKNVEELDLCEAVSIAAITNNPSKYDPIRHPDANKTRRKTVLSCMLDLGYISQREYREAINEELKLNITEKGQTSKINSWYIDTVIEDVISDLSQKYGITRKTASVLLYKGGYKIYTLMDTEIQSVIDDFFKDLDNFPIDIYGKIPQASMIVIDPNTGDILGIAGAIGEKKGNRLLNFATDSKRPSGSAIKPLSVYAPAIDSNMINWSSLINDSPIREGSETNAPWPSNANRKYVGDVTVEYALSNSLNTVAVKLLHKLGNQKSFEFLSDKLGISSLKRDEDMGDASLALGQHSIGISLRELVSAYTIFNRGIFSSSRTYSKVTDMNGKIILDNSCIENPVISPESAAIMTKLMQRVVDEGTASGLITLNEITEVAGKTGTTQYNHDKYFIGYTPTLLAGVWQGYEMPRSLDYIGTNYSAVIWDDIMSEIYRKTVAYNQQVKFEVPQAVQRLSYDKASGLPPYEFNGSNDLAYGWYYINEEH